MDYSMAVKIYTTFSSKEKYPTKKIKSHLKQEKTEKYKIL